MIDLPPMMQAHNARAPLAEAARRARLGTDAGQIYWSDEGGRLDVALVLVPEELPAGLAIPAGLIALRDALGTIGPPEMAVTSSWDGRIRLNGAQAGRLTLHAEDAWAILRLTVDLMPVDLEAEPGCTPDQTALWLEGGGDITGPALVSAFARHAQFHLSRLDADVAGVLAEWHGIIDDLNGSAGKPPAVIDVAAGPQHIVPLGLDETGALIAQSGAQALTIPLSAQIRRP